MVYRFMNVVAPGPGVCYKLHKLTNISRVQNVMDIGSHDCCVCETKFLFALYTQFGHNNQQHKYLIWLQKFIRNCVLESQRHFRETTETEVIVLMFTMDRLFKLQTLTQNKIKEIAYSFLCVCVCVRTNNQSTPKNVRFEIFKNF